MRVMLATALLLGATAAARAAECAVAEIEAALAAPFGGMNMAEREVTDIQSTEGGVWRIYTNTDGALHSIVRIDGGETGRSERRLSIVDGGTYGVAVTRVDYLRHAFIEDAGPNGAAKRTTEFFYFCGGKLFVPSHEYATVDTSSYARAGEEAQKAMVTAQDVADLTKSLAR